MKELFERFGSCVPNYVLHIPETGSSAGLWQRLCLKFSTGLKSIDSNETFVYSLKFKHEPCSGELKLSVQLRICLSALPGWCTQCSDQRRSRRGRGSKCAERSEFSPQKVPETSFKFWSWTITRSIQERAMSCTLNFIWMKHQELKTPNLGWRTWFTMRCPPPSSPIIAASGLMAHSFFISGLWAGWKQNIQWNHTRGVEFGKSALDAEEEFQKASTEFPCGIFSHLLWGTPDLGGSVQSSS